MGRWPKWIGSIGSQDGKFGFVAAADLWPNQHYANGAGGDYGGGGFVARWSPTNNVKLSAFGSLEYFVADPDIGLVPDREFLPPQIKRGLYRGQRWGKYDNRNQTAGLFGRRISAADGSSVAAVSTRRLNTPE